MSNTPPRKGARARKPEEKPPPKVFATNRRATYEYEVLETYEAGLVLLGTEIKSIREGRVSLAEAYAGPDGGELWLYNVHIPPYAQAGDQNHSPTRPRKLLLHRWQIAEVTGRVAQKGLTMVPLRLYLKGRVAKVALALVRGKRRYEKREILVQRAVDREIRRTLKDG
jgi:SsrA-binding protein